MERINFTVEGLAACSGTAAAREEILRTLVEHDFGEAFFDPGLETFGVELNSAMHSFADVRRAIGALGKRKGLVYLAVIMSP